MSRFSAFEVVAISLVLAGAAVAQTKADCANPTFDEAAKVYTPECSPYAIAGYSGGRCFITIDRNAPVSPQTIIVPPGTQLCVALINPRRTESIQFVPSFANVPAQDVAGTFVQSLSPLQSLGYAGGQNQNPAVPADFAYKIMQNDLNVTPPECTPTPSPTDIPAVLKCSVSQIEQKLTDAQSVLAAGNAAATCFAQYNGIKKSADKFFQFDKPVLNANISICDTQTLPVTYDDLKAKLQDEYTLIKKGAEQDLPLGEITQLTTIAGKCGATGNDPPTPDACKNYKDSANKLAALQTLATSLASAKSTLQQVKLQMDMIPKTMDTFFYTLPPVGHQKGYTSGTITIQAQPLVPPTTPPTPTTVATIPITFGAHRWRTFSTSTGTAFLFGRAASYSVQQQPTGTSVSQDGLCGSTNSTTTTTPPVTTTPSTTYCVANSPSSSPQILVPVVYAHWLLAGSGAGAAFPFGIHLTGGVGLNVSPANKSAAFLTGVSFQLGSVMITPAVTFFQDQRLTGGYTVGETFTSGGSVPMTAVWPRKFSIGISYVIPQLSSASPASPASSPSPSSGGSNSSQPSSGGAGGSSKKGH